MSDAVKRAHEWMGSYWKEFENTINEKLNEQLKELDRLKDKRFEQLEIEFNDSSTQFARDKKEEKKREIASIFKDFWEWIDMSMTTEKNPYIRVVAVFKGE